MGKGVWKLRLERLVGQFGGVEMRAGEIHGSIMWRA